MEKLVIRENGNETVLMEGTFEQIKEYALKNVNQLVDWLEESFGEEFEETREKLIEDLKNAKTTEEIEEAFDYVNTQMSWWGIFTK